MGFLGPPHGWRWKGGGNYGLSSIIPGEMIIFA